MIKLREFYKFLSPKWQNAFLDYKVDLKPGFAKAGNLGYHEILDQIIGRGDNSYRKALTSFLNFQKELQKIPYEINTADPLSPYWDNGFLPGLDIISLYSFLIILRPEKYVEIGSGHSTKVAYKAKIEGGLQTEIISIDPVPRSEIDHVSNRIIRQPVEKINWDDPVFTSLQEGDVLFIDSSHRILPNSDCTFIYTELIPRLPSGIILHIHDIYLPYDYPQFMCDRMYNENYFLASYFLSNPDYFEIILPNFYVFKKPKIWQEIAPIFDHPNLENVERHGGSIWLRKR